MDNVVLDATADLNDSATCIKTRRDSFGDKRPRSANNYGIRNRVAKATELGDASASMREYHDDGFSRSSTSSTHHHAKLFVYGPMITFLVAILIGTGSMLWLVSGL
eukprot:GEZU01005918.1.p1 GENE.GEZU01005918.1~~GEZU01005918.1.p1  ORF type:complete len:106 (-),score=8.42 GEZU01005918.1:358-675(-)